MSSGNAPIAKRTTRTRSCLSAADKLHNARAILVDNRKIGDAVWLRFSKEASKEDQLKYYRALVRTLRQASAPQALVDELDRVVTELEVG